MDLYQTITERMIKEMERGIIPWRKPWMASGRAVSHVTGKAYSLLNQMLLGRPGEYLTFRQAQQEGGYVRKGEKAQMLIFWKWLDSKDEETGETRQVPYLRYYSVFHIDQCEGIIAKHAAMAGSSVEADAAAEAIITEYVQREGISLEYAEGDAAYYQPGPDRIVLPMMKQFTDAAEYYGTAFHEMVHSTGHMKRLARLDVTAHFGGEEYSKEELVAEIGSAALIHHAGLETAGSFRNSAAYVQNWLQALKNDKRFIVNAAGKADKAVDFILTGKKITEIKEEAT